MATQQEERLTNNRKVQRVLKWASSFIFLGTMVVGVLTGFAASPMIKNGNWLGAMILIADAAAVSIITTVIRLRWKRLYRKT